MFISTFFIFIPFSRATLFVKATTSITHWSLLIYVNMSRSTVKPRFRSLTSAKVRHKKAPDKEKNARGIVWGKWEWFRESFSR